MAHLAFGFQGKGRLICAAFSEMRIVARPLRMHQIKIKIIYSAGGKLTLKKRANVLLRVEIIRRQLVRQNIAAAGIAAVRQAFSAVSLLP